MTYPVRLWNPATDPDLPARTETPTCWVVTAESRRTTERPAWSLYRAPHWFVELTDPGELRTKPYADRIIPAVRIPPLSAIEPLLRVQAKRRAVVVECGLSASGWASFWPSLMQIQLVILTAPTGPWDIATAINLHHQCVAAGVPCCRCGPVGQAYRNMRVEMERGVLVGEAVTDWPAEIPDSVEL